MHNYDCKTPYVDIYIDLLPINFNLLSVLYLALCIFPFRNPLDMKKIIVLLHALSAYDSLLVRYKVYSSDLRECLRTSWMYAEAYENVTIDPAPCRKNPIKK